MAGPLSSSLKSGGKDLVKELNRRLAPAVGKYSVCLTSCTYLTVWWVHAKPQVHVIQSESQSDAGLYR